MTSNEFAYTAEALKDAGEAQLYIKSVLEESQAETPLKLGFSEEELIDIMGDRRTLSTTVTEGDNQLSIPFAIPIEKVPWINTDYFDSQNDIEHYYLFGFNYLQNEQFVGQYADQIQGSLDTLGNDRASILIESVAKDEKAYIEQVRLSLGAHGVEIKQRSERPQYVTNYICLNKIIIDESLERPAQTEIIADLGLIEYELDPVISEEDLERMWEIYDGPFQQLMEGHPVKGALNRDALSNALTDDSFTISLARLNGEIIS